MASAHSLAAGEGLPTATCATLGISTTVEFGSVRATSGAKDGASLCVVLRGDDQRRNAAPRDVAYRPIDRRDLPDVAVGAHVKQVGRVLIDRVRKRRQRALARSFDASLVLIGHPLGAWNAVEEPVAEDADAGGVEPQTGPGSGDACRVAM